MEQKKFHASGTPQPDPRKEEAEQILHDLFQGTVLGTVSTRPLSASESVRDISTKTLKSLLTPLDGVDLDDPYREENITARLQRLLAEKDSDGKCARYFQGYADRLPEIIRTTFNPLTIHRYLFAADILRQVGISITVDSATAYDLGKLERLDTSK